MQIGVKIFPDNKEYVKHIKPYVDFYEVVVMEGKNYSFLKNLDKPIILHSEDFKFQTNLGNPENNSMSIKYLTFLFDILKSSKAKYAIINPGIKFNNKCGVFNHVEVLKKFDKKKLLVENQPALKTKTYPFFARNYDECYDFMKKTGVGLCMDFDHAYASAFFFERDPQKFCQDLLDIKPRHFHVSNGKNNSFIDYHLHFGEGDFNMVQIKEMIPMGSFITVDTSNDLDKQIEEIKFLRS